MPAPLSNDIRKRIVESRKAGDSITKVAREKGVSESAVLRITNTYKQTGTYTAQPNGGGRKARLTNEQLEQIKQKIHEQSDISLLELIDELNLPVCESALCRTVNNKLGLRRKKNGMRSRTEP